MRNILVIDDDPELRGRIRAALRAKGFHVMEADNVVEGVELARAELPDLIVSDVIMDNGDGYQVLAALRNDERTALIPFILMTGQATGAGLRLGMDLGADDYLVKPFTPAALLASVEARLKKTKLAERQLTGKLDDLRDCISSSLPHELLTPLTGILASADAIRAGFDGLGREEILELVGGIHEAGLRLNDMIQNYIIYSRLVMWKTNPLEVPALWEKGSVLVKGIIAAEAPERAQRHQRAADLDMELTDVAIPIKSEHLRKMVAELVDNAFKFSKSGSRVCVRTDVADSFHLSISDLGCGMSPQQISDTGAYQQFDRKLYEQQGSGLGLAIAQLLAELHRGSLSIRSEPGVGTTVKLALPLAA